jgi:hypothetical protein
VYHGHDVAHHSAKQHGFWGAVSEDRFKENIMDRRPVISAFVLFALLAGEDAESVVVHLVQPAGFSGGGDRPARLAQPDEADRGISSPTGNRGAPRYGFHRALNRSPGAAARRV